MQHPDVLNIAITGPYGSGKSSIIKTFLYRHPQYRPLYVSLSAFKDNEEAGEKQDPKILNDRIEYSILQQLFYHVKAKEVPYSRLKRIRTVSRLSILRLSLLVTVYAICIVYTYKKEWLPLYTVWKTWTATDGWLEWVAAAGLVTGTIYLVLLL